MIFRIHVFNTLENHYFADIFAQMNGKWLLCQHKDRQTWEYPGGHIEPDESPADAARRELLEETGAQDFDLRPLCDYFYSGELGGQQIAVNGQVYFANIRALGARPPFEMAETRLFAELPDALTYPECTRALVPFACAAASGFAFRFAAPGELALWRAVAKDSGEIMRVPDMHENAEFLEYAARKLAQSEAILAEKDGNPAGFVGFSRKNNSVTWLGVAENYRRCGVGSLLLTLALSELNSAKEITLNTYPASYASGHAARALYFRHGFREQTGEIFLHNGLEMVTLVLDPK